MGDGDEEVGGGLAVGGLVAHVDEVLPGLVGGAKVRHASLVDDGDFIEEVVYVFGGLVDRDDGRDFGNVR